MRELIRESEWLRTYRIDGTLQYESKLLLDNVPISADDIISRWSSFSAEEKWEFALAFQARGKIEQKDARLVEYLWQSGNSIIRSTLAPLLPLHPRRDTALHLLLSQVEEETVHRANYFQALEAIGDLGSIEPLRRIYEHLLTENEGNLDAFEFHQAIDFITCSRTLWRLTRSDRFRDSIERFASHPNPAVRNFATLSER